MRVDLIADVFLQYELPVRLVSYRARGTYLFH